MIDTPWESWCMSVTLALKALPIRALDEDIEDYLSRIVDLNEAAQAFRAGLSPAGYAQVAKWSPFCTHCGCYIKDHQNDEHKFKYHTHDVMNGDW